MQDWRQEADDRIAAHRVHDYVIRVVDPQGRPRAGVTVSGELQKLDFLFGSAVDGQLLTSVPEPDSDLARYQQWLHRHANCLVDENGMKWYTAEKERGRLDWAAGDAVTAFAAAAGMQVRGHCLFWDREKWVHDWLRQLEGKELEAAVLDRCQAAVTHYRGQVCCWDVFNEVLDGGYFQQRLPGIYQRVFALAHSLDPDARLFCNEFGILGGGAKRQRYVEFLQRLLDDGVPVGGIGIQEHACERLTTACATASRIAPQEIERMQHARLSPEEMWADLDRLGALGLPIHLTEVSCKFDDETVRAVALESLLRLAYAHPAVESCMLWGFWEGRHWLGPAACLLRRDWSPTPAATAIEELLASWHSSFESVTGADGVVRLRGHAGCYRVRLGEEAQPLQLGPLRPEITCQA